MDTIWQKDFISGDILNSESQQQKKIIVLKLLNIQPRAVAKLIFPMICCAAILFIYLSSYEGLRRKNDKVCEEYVAIKYSGYGQLSPMIIPCVETQNWTKAKYFIKKVKTFIEIYEKMQILTGKAL